MQFLQALYNLFCSICTLPQNKLPGQYVCHFWQISVPGHFTCQCVCAERMHGYVPPSGNEYAVARPQDDLDRRRERVGLRPCFLVGRARVRRVRLKRRMGRLRWRGGVVERDAARAVQLEDEPLCVPASDDAVWWRGGAARQPLGGCSPTKRGWFDPHGAVQTASERVCRRLDGGVLEGFPFEQAAAHQRLALSKHVGLKVVDITLQNIDLRRTAVEVVKRTYQICQQNSGYDDEE